MECAAISTVARERTTRFTEEVDPNSRRASIASSIGNDADVNGLVELSTSRGIGIFKEVDGVSELTLSKNHLEGSLILDEASTAAKIFPSELAGALNSPSAFADT